MLALPTFDQVIEHETPENLLPQGAEAIRHELDKWYQVELPENFDWSRTLKKGGRVTRRISKHVHDNDKFDIPNPVLENIGVLYDRYYTAPQSHYFDFTGNFNWRDGDFGDKGSCFFNGSDARHKIRLAKGWAVRFYRDKDRRDGFGRAWMFNTEYGYAVMNSYGHTQDRLCAILGSYFDLNIYRHVDYRFINESVFMNSGGITILSKDQPKRRVEIELPSVPYGWKLPQNSEY